MTYDNVYTNEAADRATIVDPRDWFTDEIARDFPYWGDERLSGADLDEQWLEQLPLEHGAARLQGDHISLPNAITEHVRKLRGPK